MKPTVEYLGPIHFEQTIGDYIMDEFSRVNRAQQEVANTTRALREADEQRNSNN